YFGGLVHGFINYIPILIIFFIFLKKFLVYPNNLVQWAFFLSSSILAAFLYFLISYNLGLTSFWLGMIQSLVYGAQIIGEFLGGKYLPMDLFPKWLLKISNFLPFRYMIYEPISIFLNKAQFNWLSLIVPLIWIVILSITASVAWKRGIKVYEAYGA
ncbi:MAG: ABC-2 family transporter protein, partial [bacterium]